MKNTHIVVLVCWVSLSLFSCRSYPGIGAVVPLPRAHAHNDYRHERPLHDALAHGFTGVEADVFLVDDDLFVAHDRHEITPERTLRGLYLDPLRERVGKNGGRVYRDGPQVTLLIDIKSEAVPTYRALHRILTEYRDIFTSFGSDGRSDRAVLAVISGNRTYELMASQKVRYAGYDGRLTDLQSDARADLMPLISDRWTAHFKWRGVGEMPAAERRKLRDIVQVSHEKGRRVRFWATPDNRSPAREALWRELVSAGVDLINTDDLEGLRQFLLSNARGRAEPEIIEVFAVGAEAIRGDRGREYTQFREQNVVITNNGAVVVICQGRNKSKWSDRSGQDLVVKTSGDSGQTWGEAKLVVTHGRKSVCPNAAVYDRHTGRIHVLYNLFMWDYTHVPEDIRGEMGDLYCRQCAVTSDDEGRTWSKPREISNMAGTNGAVMVVGSGEGIQLRHGPHKGRLIVAGGDFYKDKKVLCYYSDDHGQIWRRSNVVPWAGKMSWASESKVAELPDGTLVLNSRTFVQDGSKQRLRTRAFSADGGTTWSNLENDPALKTVSCNGSLIAVEHPRGRDGTVLLCSMPVGPGRTHGTVYVSFDGGLTWPRSKLIVPTEFAYSSLIRLPDNKIGLFFEGREYKTIKLARFTLGWLVGN
ncbi:MAG: exo-alpha-sialidase [Planctomycetota bacterium]|jgi:hypothetical protein